MLLRSSRGRMGMWDFGERRDMQQLDSASLHLAVGLRPIKKERKKISYVQAQRKFSFSPFWHVSAYIT